MAIDSEEIKVQAAGEVQLDDVALLVRLPEGSTEISLKAVFAEINLFEDLFSNSMYGNILIGDANNLLDQLSIQGLEGLRLDIRTPGLSDKQRIYKTFGIYAITDQQVLNNDRYQSYRLHFASLELLSDAMTKPLNRPIPASADSIQPLQHEIVPFLFNKYVVREGATQIPRNLLFTDTGLQKDSVSDLVMGAPGYDYTNNPTISDNVYTDDKNSCTGSLRIKFIATNWTPLKTINWVANRSVPSDKVKAGTFVFYESNKAFHFASIDALIADGKKTTGTVFLYKYSPANIVSQKQTNEDGYLLDTVAEYGRVLKMEVSTNFNLLDGTNMSAFGEQIRSVDPLLKRYREHNYSAQANFDNLDHTTTNKAEPIVPKAPDYMLGREKTTIDPRRNIIIRYRTPYFLFDTDWQNPIASHQNWLSQRAARMASMTTFSLQILVNGRTDMKVGDVLNFEYPSLRGEKDKEDTTTHDKFFNGFFLVTAIRHFISPIKHHMTLEIMKDGLETPSDTKGSTDPDTLPDTQTA